MREYLVHGKGATVSVLQQNLFLSVEESLSLAKDKVHKKEMSFKMALCLASKHDYTPF